MGHSTDAILFYGFCWDEETDQPWNIGKDDEEDTNDTDDGWEDRYARLRGLTAPSRPFPDREVPRTRENGYSCTPKDYSATEQEIIDEYSKFWKDKRSLIEASQVTLETHCLGECPMPLVAVSASLTKAHRGHMKEITSLEVKPSWEPDLRAFCELMGIDVTDKKIGWWLVSDWN